MKLLRKLQIAMVLIFATVASLSGQQILPITTYDTSNTNMPDGMVIRQASYDGTDIWLSTMGKGMVRWNKQIDSWTEYSENTVSKIVNSPGRSFYNDGFVYVANKERGIARYDIDNDHWKYYDTSNSSINHTKYEDVFIDSKGTLWATGIGVISKFENNNWTNYDTTDGIPYTKLYGIAEHIDETMWFGSETSGIVVFDNVIFTRFTVGNSALATNYATSFLSDGNAMLVGNDVVTVFYPFDTITYDRSTTQGLGWPSTQFIVKTGEYYWMGCFACLAQFDLNNESAVEWTVKKPNGKDMMGYVAWFVDSERKLWFTGSNDMLFTYDVSEFFVGINENKSLTASNAFYPNPTNNVVKTNTVDKNKYIIYDVNGKTIIETIDNTIDLSSYSKGTYMIVTIDKNNEVKFIDKIVKN